MAARHRPGFLGLFLGRWREGSGYANIRFSRDWCPFAYVGRQWTGPEGCISCSSCWNASAHIVSFTVCIPWSAQLIRPEVSGSECCGGGKDFRYAETRGDTPVYFLAIHPASQACPCRPRFKPQAQGRPRFETFPGVCRWLNAPIAAVEESVQPFRHNLQGAQEGGRECQCG